MEDSTLVLAFFTLIFASLVSGGLASNLASKKGYGTGNWFLCGLFFGIFGLIAAAGLPLDPNRFGAQKQSVECPSCGRVLDKPSRRCPKCYYEFGEDKSD